jgi:PAS domain S-box-containing protein
VKSILLVDDSADHAEEIRRSFESCAANFSLTVVSTLPEARRVLDASCPTLVICDMHLPDGTGLELLTADAENLGYPVVLMMSQGNEHLAVAALKAGALDCVVQSPATIAALPGIAERVLREWEQRQARKQAEASLRVSEERFRSLCNWSPVGIFQADAAGEWLYTNRRWQEITGLTFKESLGDGWRRATHPEDRAELLARWNRCVAGSQTFSYEFRCVRPSGEVRWVHASAAPLLYMGRVIGFVGTDDDITELMAARAQTEASLREKEAMLKEIHHRVKNNLQVVSSLLNLQASHLKDSEARAMLTDTQGRVRAMALVHEKLYQSSDLFRVSFDEFVRSLVSDVCHALGAEERQISTTVDVSGVRLAIDTAIPCGLLINELVTNAVKHAFPGARSGQVHVRLSRDDSGRLELLVCDNGVGLPPNLNPRQAGTLGLDLVFTFANQLGADVQVHRDSGTTFLFSFADGV